MEAKGPLVGVRVIDMSSSYAAPTATMYLADMGADVVKVEPPNGDDSRSWGPPFIDGESAWYLSANRNKRSLCLNIASEAGYGAMMRLLESADVFVENINPKKLSKLGLDPGTIMSRFPHLIYCAISGFGLSGPDAGLPGYDLIAQARSGLMSVTGEQGRMPQRVSTALSDVSAGTVAAFAIAAALVGRERTGIGDVVDVALLEADLALMAPRIASYLAGEPEPSPSGGTDSVIAVYQPYETADDPIVVAVVNEGMWQRFCAVLELPALAGDPELASNAGRRARREVVVQVVADRLRERPSGEWLRRLQEAGVPCARIQFLSDVVADPQVQARGAIRPWTATGDGHCGGVAAPWRLGSMADAWTSSRPAPRLGEHGNGILSEAGFSEAEIQELQHGGDLWVPSAR
jgi:crotonobetainyl-CoA:carnitine CoA-transferase CaiB-like acyl-CoA transferase